ncbi:MAG: metallophosphoesterase [bacterium]
MDSKKLKNIAELISKLSKEIEINIHNVNIDNSRSKLNGLIIAQISDLHINQWNLDLIEHTIDILNKLNPDIVTITGDAICNGTNFIPNLKNLLGKIHSNYGKFACLGNHDHSDGNDSLKIQQTYRKADFQVLINESNHLQIKGESLFIAGADDFELGEQNITKMINKIPQDAISIFLTHNPFNFKEFANFNPILVLAGHTHGGQLYFPVFHFLYKFLLKSNYISGLYKQDKSLLYVNRGIGTALVSPVLFNKKFIINTPRINSKPEISLFKLISSA